jgi:Trypsin-like peptidase domain/Colicin V production protein
MTVVDWVIVAFTALLAIHGYRRGFLVGALSLAGFVVGAVIGARIGPLVLSKGSSSTYAPLFSLGAALLLGGLLGTGFEGLGRHVRRLLWIPGFRLMDGVLGAVLTAAIALGIVWIAGALVLQNIGSGPLRQDIQTSKILRQLNQLLPPSGLILNELARIDPLPSVTGPSANVAAPNPAIIDSGGVTAAAPSVVRIVGNACGLGIEGSGWVAGTLDGADLVVTNAHVVAGEDNTEVQARGEPPGRPAQVLVFDPQNDIAILRVPGLGEPALSFARSAASGTAAAILGYPENGGYDRQPGRLGETQSTSTENAYGQGPVTRQIAALRGLVRPGNSGGPMVNASGHVVATVFAEVTNAPAGKPGGFAVPNAVVKSELAKAQSRQTTVGTQACAD